MGDLAFQCPECSKNLAVSDRFVGVVFACPDCQVELRAPTPTFGCPCPSCASQFFAPDTLHGQIFGCPNCNVQFVVPQSATVRCPGCGVHLEMDDDYFRELGGSAVQCPQCNSHVPVPVLPRPPGIPAQDVVEDFEEEPESVIFKCRACQSEIEMKGETFDRMTGRLIRCPKCRRYVRVPATRPRPAAPVPRQTAPPKMMDDDENSMGRTMRLDNMLDFIPQAHSLEEGLCPYCRMPLQRLQDRSFMCKFCQRVIRSVHHL